MNGNPPSGSFSDFLSSTTPDEGPVKTKDIPRQRYKRRAKRQMRKKKREMRA
jgi:hypothetical protein